MLDLIWILLVVVPMILFVVTVTLIVNGAHKLENYTECAGIIVRFYEATSPASTDFGKKAISPVVSYTVNGRKYEFIGHYCSTSMKVGQKINILYNHEDPSKATIKKGLYVAPMITGALTLLFTLALVIFVVLKNKGLISF